MLRDKRIRFAVAVAVVEWLLVGGVAAWGGSTALMGGVLVVATWLQLSALFLRRPPSGVFPQAQQHFMAGEYAEAAALLADQPDAQSQTLRGNALRQLGDLAQSEAVLRAVVAQHPQDHFPLYGLGRTLLAKGDFAAAAQYIGQALQHGGRKTMRVELALAYYLSGADDAARENAAQSARLLALEPYRVWMANYLLFKLADDPKAPALLARTAPAIAYWEAEAGRFSGTPYGEHLSAIVEAFKVK